MLTSPWEDGLSEDNNYYKETQKVLKMMYMFFTILILVTELCVYNF